MKILRQSILPPARLTRAMTLLEVMIAATLMSVIIYALYTMFDRVQRVLRASTTQVDVLESGRAAVEMIERDLEQLHVGGGPDEKNMTLTNAFVYVDYTANTQPFNNPPSGFPAVDARPVTMFLPDGTASVHELHSLFFVTRPDSWKAIGYRVANPTNVTMPPPNGVGTLYRFERSYPSSSMLLITNNNYTASGQYLTNNPFYRFFSVPNSFLAGSNAAYQALGDGSILNDFSRVMDGVVNFQCRLIAYDPTRQAGQYYALTLDQTNRGYEAAFQTNLNDRSRLPVCVEVNISLLEPKVLDLVRAQVPGSPAAISILTNQYGKIHTISQRIPVRLKP